MISPAINLPAAQAARSLSPPARPPQLALYISPTYYFAYMEEREGKERECVLSLLQELAPREKKWTNHFINETERLWAQDTLNNVL